MRNRRLLIFALLLCLALPIWEAPTSHAQQESDAVATETLALVNQWRVEAGLWPLRGNPSLQAAARSQAQYVYSRLQQGLVEEYNDYHLDANRRTPLQRLVQAYQWPTYGRPEQGEVGENAAEYTPRLAVNFWKSSGVHSRAALSPAYREAGVVAIKQKNNYLIMLVFGGRPNTLPALVNARGDTLYLTTDRSRYNKWSAEALRVQLYDANREPLGESASWSPTLPIPQGVRGKLFVRYTIVKRLDVWTEVDFAKDVAILPGVIGASIELQASDDQSARPVATEALPPSPTAIVVVVQPSATPTLPPTDLPRATATATRRVGGLATNTRAPTRTLLPLFTPAPTNMPQPTITSTLPPPTPVAVLPTTTPSPQPTSARPASVDMVLLYSARSLTLYNASSRALNLDPLQVGRLRMSNWTQVASFPSGAFPAGHCLQATLLGSSEAAPTQCRFVRSQISISAARVFWTQGVFEVSYNGTVIQTCQAGAGRCEVDLP